MCRDLPEGGPAGGRREWDWKNAAPVGGGTTRYSLCAFEDGTRYVKVDTDQTQFDGQSEREQRRLATQIIKKNSAGHVIGETNRVFVNGRSASEYGFPVKHLTPDKHEAKMRASTELDNLLDAGTTPRTGNDGRDGHIHPDAAGGFLYLDAIFKVGKEYYRDTVNIEQTSHGRLLKDVTQIENITQAISNSYGQNPKSTILRDVSIVNVTQGGGTAKFQYSIKESAD